MILLLRYLRTVRFLTQLISISLVALPTMHLHAVEHDTTFKNLEQQYTSTISPLIKAYCLDCHSTEAREGELDLEQFSSFEKIRHAPQAWQKVKGMLRTKEMPPADSPQLTAEESAQLRNWVDHYLDSEARANAGDPGPVILRRLNNAEYNYTIHDLTGIDLQPTREFPTDGAAGEGFTNTGGALAMSPAMIDKYLDAAKGIADHLVLLPDGFRFSHHKTRRDRTNEILTSIRKLYFRYTGDLGDASKLNRWNVSDPTILTNNDGRVDLENYFTVLIENRDQIFKDLSSTATIANNKGLSKIYLRHLAQMLTSNEPSLLLNQIRSRWRSANLEDALSIANDINAWQEKLWKFNPVGHFGQVKGWQEPITPLSTTENFRVKLEPTPDAKALSLYLVVGSAGDGNNSDKAVWKRPRIERPGRPPTLLRDLRATSIALPQKRDAFLANFPNYLSAARYAQKTTTPTDLAQLAAQHKIDPLTLECWLRYLGISYTGQAFIQEFLDNPIASLAGHNFVKGWGVEGQSALSLVANASDEAVRVPGDLGPHKIAVHPRPERWVAVGWQSPSEGRVRLAPHIKDAHAACGNGIHWSVQLRRGGHLRDLTSGDLELGGTASVEPINDFAIKPGDLISLVISAKDNNHGCDLTEIDLEISELDGEQRSWSLSKDCADSIDAGNPHADQHGNPTVWHFYTGMNDSTGTDASLPPDSHLAQWLVTSDPTATQHLATQISALLNSPPPEGTSAANIELYRQLTDCHGPLFSHINTAVLADSVAEAHLKNSNVGLTQNHFPPKSSPHNEDLIVTAPSILEIVIPQEFAQEATFVAQGSLTDASNGEASTQFLVTTTPPKDADALLPGVPIVVHANSKAQQRLQKSYQEFQALFPTAMCYSRIVPVDVVVTLVLYYREDDQLSRLMLSNEERQALNRLWDELHYVSQDAFSLVTVFEQLLEFASQDDDPSKYKPLGKAIYANAEKFRAKLIESEPYHINSLLDFASRAYRRPLTAEEASGIRQLYAQLRSEEMPHDEALRLTLARVLTGPAFLYRLERPNPGTDRTLVSNWELATRLSYFLWSTAPDSQLRTAAAKGLQDPTIILAQTQRMLRDQRTRNLAVEFACQWLHIRDFDKLSEKSERHFPEFADLQGDMYEESIRFFTDFFQNNGSVLDILGANHTFLNESLASHYAIPGIAGEAWQKVEGLQSHSRGGILAQATVLSSQSGASRTSPILRGNWISETLLGERLPRPPKDVPVLPETAPAGLTERQLTEQHSSNPACAKCHARIDPYGFALEEFDAIGRFRQQDAHGLAIDTSSTLPDGTALKGIEGVRNYLLTIRKDTFVRHFCQKLLGYALGRSTQLSDEPILDDMMQNLADNDYRISQAIETIVLSDQFRKIRGREYNKNLLTKTTTTPE